MQIVIAEVGAEGLHLAESLTSALGRTFEAPGVTVAQPIQVSAFAQKHDDDLLVAIEAAGTLRLACDRCLQTVDRPYHGAFHLDYPIQHRLRIEITDDIRQEIMLAYPMKHLCREDCRGLCSCCGQNLNEGPCACPDQSDARRWASQES